MRSWQVTSNLKQIIVAQPHCLLLESVSRTSNVGTIMLNTTCCMSDNQHILRIAKKTPRHFNCIGWLNCWPVVVFQCGAKCWVMRKFLFQKSMFATKSFGFFDLFQLVMTIERSSRSSKGERWNVILLETSFADAIFIISCQPTAEKSDERNQVGLVYKVWLPKLCCVIREKFFSLNFRHNLLSSLKVHY